MFCCPPLFNSVPVFVSRDNGALTRCLLCTSIGGLVYYASPMVDGFRSGVSWYVAFPQTLAQRCPKLLVILKQCAHPHSVITSFTLAVFGGEYKNQLYTLDNRWLFVSLSLITNLLFITLFVSLGAVVKLDALSKAVTDTYRSIIKFILLCFG